MDCAAEGLRRQLFERRVLQAREKHLTEANEGNEGFGVTGLRNVGVGGGREGVMWGRAVPTPVVVRAFLRGAWGGMARGGLP